MYFYLFLCSIFPPGHKCPPKPVSPSLLLNTMPTTAFCCPFFPSPFPYSFLNLSFPPKSSPQKSQKLIPSIVFSPLPLSIC